MHEVRKGIQRARKALSRRISRVCARAPGSPASQRIMRLQGKHFCDFRRIEEISARSFDVAAGCDFSTVAPAIFGKDDPKAHVGTFAPLRFHELKDAVISAHVPQVAVGTSLGVSAYCLENTDRVSPTPSATAHFEKDFCVCGTTADRTLDKGIFIDGDGSFN
jgi:hypothetical protein